MRKFRFRLNTLQRHKEAIEREKQGHLAKELNKLRLIEDELNAIDESAFKTRNLIGKISTSFPGERLTSAQYWVTDNYLKGLRVRREDVKLRMQEQEKIAENAYKEFVSARKEVKVLSTLHEKQFQQHKDSEQKRETKQLDDIYIMRNRLTKGKVENE